MVWQKKISTPFRPAWPGKNLIAYTCLIARDLPRPPGKFLRPVVSFDVRELAAEETRFITSVPTVDAGEWLWVLRHLIPETREGVKSYKSRLIHGAGH